MRHSLAVVIGKSRNWIVLCCALTVHLSTVSQAQVYQLLYSFTGNDDGQFPYAGLAIDSRGTLYGTTSSAGNLSCQFPNGCGTVFKFGKNGFWVLHAFSGFPDGGVPYDSVLVNNAGYVFGTASSEGYCCGTAFELSPSGNLLGAYSFDFGSDRDGQTPRGGLVWDALGNFYGTTQVGGTHIHGTVFKITPTGEETVLYNFKGQSDGGYPDSQLLIDAAGNLYGTAPNGGVSCPNEPLRCGVIFKIDTAGNETVIHRFTGGADGAHPHSGLARDSVGNLYGTAYDNTDCGYVCGTGNIFRVDSQGKFKVMHTFAGPPSDGRNPGDTLVFDSAGNGYGTTVAGGKFDYGTVFVMSPAGKVRLLYSFSDGGAPWGALVRDASGNLYGTALFGGELSLGSIFEIKP